MVLLSSSATSLSFSSLVDSLSFSADSSVSGSSLYIYLYFVFSFFLAKNLIFSSLFLVFNLVWFWVIASSKQGDEFKRLSGVELVPQAVYFYRNHIAPKGPSLQLVQGCRSYYRRPFRAHQSCWDGAPRYWLHFLAWGSLWGDAAEYADPLFHGPLHAELPRVGGGCRGGPVSTEDDWRQ